VFNYSLDFKSIDFRKNPELYQVGRGEQGVLLVEPYKSEILPHWRFKNPKIAKESSKIIYNMFLSYLDQDDFVGADMARKFLQMGYTRSRRYANHKSGKKYKLNPQKMNSAEAEKEARKDILPYQEDTQKAESAKIFKEKWHQAKSNEKYLLLMENHKKDSKLESLKAK
jgi:Domain of unknown function (DUF4385)